MKPVASAGFTLIELLIVVAILGILVAIAIPRFEAYRQRAYNGAAVSDLGTLRIEEEAMYAEFQDYGAALVTPGTVTLVGATTGTSRTVALSSGVSAGAKVLIYAGRNVSYTIAAKHLYGDSAFGMEGDIGWLFYRGIAAGTQLQDSNIPPATLGQNFNSPWIIKE